MVGTKFLVSIALTLGFISFTEASPKTVCSITINSDDEIQMFQKHLANQNFIFRELVTGDRDWLKRACQQGVHCDVVVMSGHFGGSFFGKKGFLALEDMEAASCDPSCNGIFHKPTEVYMYGCNTLAGKNKDRRTPEEYIRVLREDGYSMAEAQQIAAFLYSPFGAAFYSRMSKVFSQVPRIYGFDGKAPLGAAIRPLLSIYVKQMAPHFYNYINDPTTDKNVTYANILAKTNSTQIAGDRSRTEYPACYINSAIHSTTDKLEWIKDQILLDLSENKFDTIPMAQYYFKDLRNKNYRFTDYEESILDQLRTNSTLKNAISTLKTKLNVMPMVAFQLSDFQHWMEWVTDKEFYQMQLRALLGDDPSTYSSSQRDFVCSLNRSIDIRLEQIPQSFLHNPDFMWALACVKPIDPRIILLLSEYIIRGPASSGLIEIASYLGKSKTPNIEVHWNLLKAYLAHTEENSRWFMINALRTIPATDPQIMDRLADELLKTRSANLGSVISDALGKGKPSDPETQVKVINALVYVLNHPQEFETRFSNPQTYANSISYAINLLKPIDARIHKIIRDILDQYQLTDQQRSNLKLAIGSY